MKLYKPNVLSGKKVEVDNFIFEMKQYIDNVSLGDSGKACRFVTSHFKGDALTWWRSYSDDDVNVYS